MSADTERDRFVRLLFYAVVLLVGYLSFLVVGPFLGALAWAAVFAMLLTPLFRHLTPRLGTTGAALATTLLAFVLIIGPLVTMITVLAQVSCVGAVAGARRRLRGDDTPCGCRRRGTPCGDVCRSTSRPHRRLVRRAKACAGGGPEQRHALRIAAKRLRYAAEFFAPLFDAARARAYAAALASLQDVLGRGNDAVTATRLVDELAAEGDEPALAALRAWLAATTAKLEPELARAWKQYAKAQRFWRKP